MTSLLPGRATPEGTKKFSRRLPAQVQDAYRRAHGLTASSIGLGTYLGEPTPEDSAAYREALRVALECGLNVFDTAINYRHQASERDLGAMLRQAIENGVIDRSQVIVSTKGGFLPLDFDQPGDPRKYLSDLFLKTGLCPPDEIVGGCQCMTPEFVADQIDRSRHNLGLDTLDIYFLHNPEMQLEEIPRADFNRRLRRVFETLETARAEGKIATYGIATWAGLRQEPTVQQHRLVLEDIYRLAFEVGGDTHGFGAIQLPINLMMSEALRLEHDPKHHPGKTVLEIAEGLGLFTMASASILQGQLAMNLPQALGKMFPGLSTDAQRALQHTRCAPGVTTALVGMKQAEHVRENAALLSRPSPSSAFIAKLYAAPGARR